MIRQPATVNGETGGTAQAGEVTPGQARRARRELKETGRGKILERTTSAGLPVPLRPARYHTPRGYVRWPDRKPSGAYRVGGLTGPVPRQQANLTLPLALAPDHPVELGGVDPHREGRRPRSAAEPKIDPEASTVTGQPETRAGFSLPSWALPVLIFGFAFGLFRKR